MNSKYLKCIYHPFAEVVDHYKTGDIICTECGLVLTERNDIQECGEIIKELIGITPKNFWKFTEDIREYCHRLHLCDAIAEDAINYFRESMANKKLRSTEEEKLHLLAAAAIYNSAKYHKHGILPIQIEFSTGIDRHSITSISEKMCDKLRLKLYPITPESFITKFRYFLDMDFEAEKLSCHIIKMADDMGLVFTHNSEHVAAVTLYITSFLILVNGKREPKEIEEINNLCHITYTTFKNIYNKLIKKINELIPKKFVNDIHLLPKQLK